MATTGRTLIRINNGRGSFPQSTSSIQFFSDDTPGQFLNPAGGSTAIFEITASMVSASTGLIATSSDSGLLPVSGNYIRILSNDRQFGNFNLLFLSSSFASTASLNSSPYPAIFKSASISMGQADSFLAHEIYNAFAFQHSASLARRAALNLTSSVSHFFGSASAGNEMDIRRRLPAISASLDSGSNAIKIFIQRTGSADIDFSPMLTSSFGFSIKTISTGSGDFRFPRLNLGYRFNPTTTTSSFNIRLADSKGKGLVIESNSHKGQSGSIVGSSNLASPKAFFMSGSGKFGINTLTPHTEFEVKGTMSASSVDAPTMTIAGTEIDNRFLSKLPGVSQTGTFTSVTASVVSSSGTIIGKIDGGSFN